MEDEIRIIGEVFTRRINKYFEYLEGKIDCASRSETNQKVIELYSVLDEIEDAFSALSEKQIDAMFCKYFPVRPEIEE